MGHLINARSTRLGWFKHWWDVWFAKNSHYAELTMSCMRIRYFLIYLFFSRTIMIEHMLLFSHFEMVKLYKLFLVRIYYYDSALEDSINDCLDFFKYHLYIRKGRYQKINKRNKWKMLRENHLAYSGMLQASSPFDKISSSENKISDESNVGFSSIRKSAIKYKNFNILRKKFKYFEKKLSLKSSFSLIAGLKSFLKKSLVKNIDNSILKNYILWYFWVKLNNIYINLYLEVYIKKIHIFILLKLMFSYKSTNRICFYLKRVVIYRKFLNNLIIFIGRSSRWINNFRTNIIQSFIEYKYRLNDEKADFLIFNYIKPESNLNIKGLIKVNIFERNIYYLYFKNIFLKKLRNLKNTEVLNIKYSRRSSEKFNLVKWIALKGWFDEKLYFTMPYRVTKYGSIMRDFSSIGNSVERIYLWSLFESILEINNTFRDTLDEYCYRRNLYNITQNDFIKYIVSLKSLESYYIIQNYLCMIKVIKLVFPSLYKLFLNNNEILLFYLLNENDKWDYLNSILGNIYISNNLFAAENLSKREIDSHLLDILRKIELSNYGSIVINNKYGSLPLAGTDFLRIKNYRSDTLNYLISENYLTSFSTVGLKNSSLLKKFYKYNKFFFKNQIKLNRHKFSLISREKKNLLRMVMPQLSVDGIRYKNFIFNFNLSYRRDSLNKILNHSKYLILIKKWFNSLYKLSNLKNYNIKLKSSSLTNKYNLYLKNINYIRNILLRFKEHTNKSIIPYYLVLISRIKKFEKNLFLNKLIFSRSNSVNSLKSLFANNRLLLSQEHRNFTIWHWIRRLTRIRYDILPFRQSNRKFIWWTNLNLFKRNHFFYSILRKYNYYNNYIFLVHLHSSYIIKNNIRKLFDYKNKFLKELYENIASSLIESNYDIIEKEFDNNRLIYIKGLDSYRSSQRVLLDAQHENSIKNKDSLEEEHIENLNIDLVENKKSIQIPTYYETGLLHTQFLNNYNLLDSYKRKLKKLNNMTLNFDKIIKNMNIVNYNFFYLKNIYCDLLSNLMNKSILYNSDSLKLSIKKRLIKIYIYWMKLVKLNSTPFFLNNMLELPNYALLNIDGLNDFITKPTFVPTDPTYERNKNTILGFFKRENTNFENSKIFKNIVRKKKLDLFFKDKSNLRGNIPVWKRIVKWAKYPSIISKNSKFLKSNDFLLNKSLGIKFKRKHKVIKYKKTFLSVMLNHISQLPLDILASSKSRPLTAHEKRIQVLLEYIENAELKMKKYYLEKIRRRRLKLKDKMLNDPNNKFTEDDFDNFLLDSLKTRNEVVSTKKKFDMEEPLPLIDPGIDTSFIFNKVDIIQKKNKYWLKLLKYFSGNIKFKHIYYKLFWNIRSLSNYNYLHIDSLRYSIIRKNLLNLCKRNILSKKYDIYKYRLSKLDFDKENTIIEPHLDKRYKYGLPKTVINKMFKSLMTGNVGKLRRLFSHKDVVADLTRDRSLSVILFSAVCCYWFKNLPNSVRLGTLVLYDLFRYLHLFETM